MMPYQYAKNICIKMVKEKSSICTIDEKLINLCKEKEKYCLTYKKAFFVILKDINTKFAIKYGEEIIEQGCDDLSFIQVLAIRQQRLGNIERYVELIELYNEKIKQRSIFRKIFLKDRFSMEIFKMTLLNLMNIRDSEQIQKYIDREMKINRRKSTHIARVSFIMLKDRYIDIALNYGDMVLEKEKDKKFIQVLYTRAKRIKDKKAYLSLFKTIV